MSLYQKWNSRRRKKCKSAIFTKFVKNSKKNHVMKIESDLIEQKICNGSYSTLRSSLNQIHCVFFASPIIWSKNFEKKKTKTSVLRFQSQEMIINLIAWESSTGKQIKLRKKNYRQMCDHARRVELVMLFDTAVRTIW